MQALADEVLDKKIAAELRRDAKRLRNIKAGLGDGRVPDALRTDGFRELESYGIRLSAKAGDNVVVDPMLGEMLQATLHLGGMHLPDQLASIVRAARSYTRWWKAAVTVGRTIDFVMNNVLGGLWNATTRGIGPKQYNRIGLNAIKFRTAGRLGASYEEALEAVDPAMREYFDWAVRKGVVGGAFAEQDLRKIIDRSGTLTSKVLSRRGLKFWSADDFALFQAGGAMMEASEDWMRMALFVEEFDRAIARGLDPERAADVGKSFVDAIHFDYSDLTSIERSIQNAIPFYTWTRKNVPLQLRMLIEQPRIVARYSYLMNEVDENWQVPEDYEDLPIPYAQGHAAIVGIQGEGAFATRILFDPRLPITDLGELFEAGVTPSTKWLEYISSQMGPWVTLPFDLQQQAEWGDVNAPAGFNQTVAWLNDKGFDFKVSDEGDWRIPRWQRTAFESAFPLWTYTVERAVPQDPARKQQLGYQEPDPGILDRAEGFGRRYLSGLGVRVSSPAQVDDVAYEQREQVQDILDELKIEGAYQG